MSRKIVSYFFSIFVIVFFALFFFLPVWQVIKGGIRDNDGNFTMFYFMEVFRNPIYLNGLLNSFLIAICTTALSLLIACAADTPDPRDSVLVAAATEYLRLNPCGA